MSIDYDCHLHSHFSGDSDTPPELMADRACALGLRGICFTEHLDLDAPDDGTPFLLDFDAYFEAMEALKMKYRGRLDIRAGMEFGIQPQHAMILKNLAARWPFDFLIASQHYVDGKDPYYPAYFSGRKERDCYEEYFHLELRSLERCTDYDTLGHMDYIVRYGPNQNREYAYNAYADCIDPILRRLIEHGKCLELNTGGLKYGLGEPNPSREILRRYRELGGELITIGSDAHVPEFLAYEFPAADEILKTAGFRYYTIFRERKAVQLPL